MNFELTNEQKDIKKAAREFAEGMFPEAAENLTSRDVSKSSLEKGLRPGLCRGLY
jgi:hypothetical protein